MFSSRGVFFNLYNVSSMGIIKLNQNTVMKQRRGALIHRQSKLKKHLIESWMPEPKISIRVKQTNESVRPWSSLILMSDTLLCTLKGNYSY